MKTEKSQRRLEILFVVALGVFMFIWSVVKPYNYAPDEYMRYDVPLYIFKHGRLPLGDDPEIRNEIWGFSYAFLPTWLEPLLAALFMHMVSLIPGTGEFALVVAARFVSVLAVSGMVYCFARILDRLFPVQIKWMVLFLISLMPQVTFIGSYVNQDSLNLLGSSMILLSWVCGIQDGWNYKNGTLLALGIVIVALSYYFGYGWILGSIIIFFASHFLHIGKNRPDKKMWKVTALICVIVIGLTAFFFLRNLVVYHGDLLGRKSMAAAQTMYAADDYKPQNHLSLQQQGMSFGTFLKDISWWDNSLVSFIGCFGYMQFRTSGWVYGAYGFIYALLIIMAVVSVVQTLYNKQGKQAFVKLMITFEFVLPVFLSLWYSYSSDYQPQGRYMMSLLPALMVTCGDGMQSIEKNKKAVPLVFVIIIVFLALLSFKGVYLPS